ncbi:hypothetical protein CR203_16795 [Salipaludibacillus neizhouensis]|uniref:VOC domain-containing protein n=1 Tax=Salipaludibacillus neizhouensis TaxID=885475 RepID=A0A3A9K791_9BACI|nr:VOC family protein [Salipaludibacillus neizhouensis]RKL66211.1 hypothetical protein CR203_16795 [Salipaludibacillus neizhouensis]
MLQHVNAVVLSVRNITISKEFYEQKLGFECIDEGDIRGHRYARYIVGEGLANLELIEVTEEEFLSKDLEGELSPFNFYTQTVDTCFDQLKKKGVEVFNFKESPSVFTFDFKDPDGNILNVCEERDYKNPFYSSIKEAYEENSERIFDGVASVFLSTKNVDKLSDWFLELEGMKLFDDWNDGKGLILPSGIKGASIGIFMEEEAKVRTSISKPSSIPFIYFQSNEIEKDFEKFKRNNVSVTALIHGCFYFTDIDGNLFGVRE